jgi:methylenetetrahydrofolate reductase (NADPH)
MESDIAFLKKKVEAGARFLITQLFFDNELYFDFVREARTAGIDVPIIPGIMPVTGYAQVKRFTERCGASLPEDYERELAHRADDPDAVKDLGVAYASLQCADLLARGAPGIHFYTLNRSPATRAILSALRTMKPWVAAARPV